MRSRLGRWMRRLVDRIDPPKATEIAWVLPNFEWDRMLAADRSESRGWS